MTNAEMAVKVGNIETTVTDMHNRLFGNGQPGVIQVHDQAIGGLKTWKSYITGAVAALSFIVGGGSIVVFLRALGWI